MTEPNARGTARLRAEQITVGYDRTAQVSAGLSITVPDDSFTAIIGPNGCAASRPSSVRWRVCWRPAAVRCCSTAATCGGIARRSWRGRWAPAAVLAGFDGIRVADLVARGRAPHMGLIQTWLPADEQAVAAALAATRLTDLSGRLVDELSGGQRQRVRVAMLLAQQTSIMLLDEPTTFLDIAHQYDLMELLRGFHDEGRDDRDRAPRPEPGGALCRPSHRHEGGAHRHLGAGRAGHHSCSDPGRLRASAASWS